MTYPEKVALAVAAISGGKGSGAWMRINCPLCPYATGKRDITGALHFHKMGGWFRCHRCGFRGRHPDFGDDAPAGARPAFPASTPGARVLPPEALPLDPSAAVHQPALEYLLGRGMDAEDIADKGLRVCTSGPYAGRIIVPVYEGGRLVTFVARTWRKKAPGVITYRLPDWPRPGAFFQGDALSVDTTGPIIVVEGVFDALHLGGSAIAALNVPLGEEQVRRLIGAKRPVVIALDGDAWERGEILAMRLQLEGRRAGYIRLPPKMDPDEVPARDIWALTRTALERGEARWES